MEIIELVGQLQSEISELKTRLKGVEDVLLKASGVRAETDPSRVENIVVGDAPIDFTKVA